MDTIRIKIEDGNDSTNATNSNEEEALPKGKIILSLEINENDVLCGRGKRIENCPGNCKYRDLIKQYRAEYLCAKPKGTSKSHIAEMINDIVKKSCPPGRFLKRLGTIEDEWYEISTLAAREKTCQALREKKKKSTTFPIRYPRSLSLSSSSESEEQEEPFTSHDYQEETQNAKRKIPFSIKVQPHDVLFDGNNHFQDHEGNQRFVSIARAYEDDFYYATEERKRQISRLIVRQIREKKPQGRFLKLDALNCFVEMSMDEALERASQVQRDFTLERDRIAHSHIAKLYLTFGNEISSPHLRSMNSAAPYLISRKRGHMALGEEGIGGLREVTGYHPVKKIRYF